MTAQTFATEETAIRERAAKNWRDAAGGVEDRRLCLAEIDRLRGLLDAARKLADDNGTAGIQATKWWDQALNERDALAAELAGMRDILAWAYGKLVHREFSKQDDALMMDEIKLLLMEPQQPETHPVALEPTQANVLAWAVNSFGPIARNRDERAARLAEEAIEIAQAEGVSLDIVVRIATRVYSRPAGELWQELGGLGITMLAFAENAGLNVDTCTEREWRRVLSKTPEWWAKKHAEKVEAGTANLSSTASEPPVAQPEPRECCPFCGAGPRNPHDYSYPHPAADEPPTVQP